jgi:arylsulfatase A
MWTALLALLIGILGTDAGALRAAPGGARANRRGADEVKTSSEDAARPNIIFIDSDDVGIGDIHFSGGPFHTPNLDKLAASGTNFTYCYSTPLCGPSRCESLTGRYPFRTGLISNNSHKAASPEREIMIPTVMKKAGYITASCGKWGQIQLGPKEWGFDEWFVFPGSGRYWAEQKITYDDNGKSHELKEGEYIPDLMHSWVVDFIDKHKDRPFFLYYPMSSIHGPILRTPDSKKGADKDQLYADNIEYMDKLVGKLMKELDRSHLREKTLVVFTGDNGTARFGTELATVNGKKVNGQKGQMLEGGSRVPLCVSWPGHTPQDKNNNDLIDFSDFFATFAELGGAELPKGVTLDSHSFAPQILGKKGSPRDWVYVELNGKSYVRDAKYKLTNDGKMFDLSGAPFEEKPVEDSDSEAAAARKKLQAVLDEHPAAPGVNNPQPAKRRAQRRKERNRELHQSEKKSAA